jgi:hypothetical protein
MGARPSSFKRGGGFLNNVDGMITDYEFTTEFPGGGKQRGKKSSDFTPLFFILSARVDGADEDVTTTLNAGNADNFEISDDGKTLTPVEDGYELSANSALGKFITSLCEAGFPETNLPEDTINYEPIIGTRVRFVQVRNEEATKKYGKRKSKDGREFDRQDLKISNVLDLPSAKGGKANGAAQKGPKGKAAKGGGDDVADLAAQTLRDILEAADGAVPVDKLKMKVFAAFGAKHPQRAMRDPVHKYLADADNLDGIEGVVYDSDEGTVALA